MIISDEIVALIEAFPDQSKEWLLKAALLKCEMEILAILDREKILERVTVV